VCEAEPHCMHYEAEPRNEDEMYQMMIAANIFKNVN